MTFLIKQQQIPTELRVTLAPAHSVLAALPLLANGAATLENEPALKAISVKMSADEHAANKKIFANNVDHLIPEQEFSTFADYLDSLSQTADGDTVNHLRSMWRTYFMPEWDRHHYLKSMVDNLNTRDWPTQSAEGAVEAFLRRPVPGFIGRQLDGIRQLVFAPTPWLNLQAARFGDADTLWLFVPADARKLPMRYEPIQRSEVLRTISALADEARLQILELLAAFGPMRSQEIIAKLNVSQPTVSRQLKSLKNANFISEERGGDASKIFCLNPDRLGQVTFMLATLMSADNARMVLNDVRLDQPADLRPLLNDVGKVHRYPKKLEAQKLVLDYLAPKFEAGKSYSEKEVNELLNVWHIFKDPARLRRDLVDYDYLQRTADGSRYWRVE